MSDDISPKDEGSVGQAAPHGPAPTAQLLKRLLSGEITWPQAIHLWLEEKPVKRGWYVLLVLGCIGFCVWNYRLQADKITDIQEQDAEKIRDARDDRDKTVRRADDDRGRAFRDRDDAMRTNAVLQTRLDTLSARLDAYALRANVQMEPTNAIDVKLEALLDQIRLAGPAGLEFECSLNGVPLTNEGTIVLGTNKTLSFAVKNVGEIAAERLTVQFAPMIYGMTETNFLYNGWTVHGHVEGVAFGGKKTIMPLFDVEANHVIKPGSRWSPAPITIAECQSPMFRAQFIVYSSRSKAREWYFWCSFQK